MTAEPRLWGEQARLKVTEQNFEEPGFTCDERLWVTKVMPGGLAEAAGLEIGWRLVAFQNKELPLWEWKCAPPSLKTQVARSGWIVD